MTADYEDLQESEIYVERFKSQEVFVKEEYHFCVQTELFDFLIVQERQC